MLLPVQAPTVSILWDRKFLHKYYVHTVYKGEICQTKHECIPDEDNFYCPDGEKCADNECIDAECMNGQSDPGEACDPTAPSAPCLHNNGTRVTLRAD